MYRTVAPALAASRAGPVRELLVRVELVCARTFPGGRPLEDEGLDRYFTDMAAAFGHRYESTALDRATSYSSMAAEMLAALPPRVGRIDHIVLAHATPDIDCRASVGCFLVEAAGDPIVFGVSDQGLAAPFTALRVAADFPRGERVSGRTVVLVLDQSSVPWEVPRRELVPACDAAVALVLQPAPAGRGVLLGQHSAVPPADVPDLLVEYLHAVAAWSAAPVTLVAGRHVPLTPAACAGVGQIRRVPEGRVCTGVWATMHELVGQPAPGVMVLAEYDPDLRYLCLATLEQDVTAC